MNYCDESKPYIFISYSHRDTQKVVDIISRLREEGYNVWYDDGIDPGTEWDENIARHVKECSYFVAFVSANYLASSNCKDELNYSRDLNKKQLLIYLEDVNLPDGMAMRMNRIQGIFWNKYERNGLEEAYSRLFLADGIDVAKVLDKKFDGISRIANTTTNEKKLVKAQKESNKKLKLWPILLILFLVAAGVTGVFLLKSKPEQPVYENEALKYIHTEDVNTYDPYKAYLSFAESSLDGDEISTFMAATTMNLYLNNTKYCDYEKAADYYEKCMNDNPYAELALGIMYESNCLASDDENYGISLINDALSKIDEKKLREDMTLPYRGEACYLLAIIYREGYGNKSDYMAEKVWLERALDSNCMIAYTSLGNIYSCGEHIPHDLDKAVNYYNKAVTLNPENVEANYMLGVIYSGLTVEFKPYRDYEIARAYLEKAGKLGSSKAYIMLGMLYENGYGVDSDKTKAKAYYSKALEMGDEDAQSMLHNVDKKEGITVTDEDAHRISEALSEYFDKQYKVKILDPKESEE